MWDHARWQLRCITPQRWSDESKSQVFGMSFRFDGGSVSSFVVNLSDLLRGGGRFRRPLPNNMPIGGQSSGSTGADDIKHKLSAVVAISMR